MIKSDNIYELAVVYLDYKQLDDEENRYVRDGTASSITFMVSGDELFRFLHGVSNTSALFVNFLDVDSIGYGLRIMDIVEYAYEEV